MRIELFNCDLVLYFRTERESAAEEGRDPVPCKTLDAGALWDKVAYTAWACADPGVQFDTTINEWHTCPEAGKINGSNPCSEYMFLDDTACNLASINLLHYYDLDTHKFNIEDFRHSVRSPQTLPAIVETCVSALRKGATVQPNKLLSQSTRHCSHE